MPPSIDTQLYWTATFTSSQWKDFVKSIKLLANMYTYLSWSLMEGTSMFLKWHGLFVDHTYAFTHQYSCVQIPCNSISHFRSHKSYRDIPIIPLFPFAYACEQCEHTSQSIRMTFGCIQGIPYLELYRIHEGHDDFEPYFAILDHIHPLGNRTNAIRCLLPTKFNAPLTVMACPEPLRRCLPSTSSTSLLDQRQTSDAFTGRVLRFWFGLVSDKSFPNWHEYKSKIAQYIQQWDVPNVEYHKFWFPHQEWARILPESGVIGSYAYIEPRLERFEFDCEEDNGIVETDYPLEVKSEHSKLSDLVYVSFGQSEASSFRPKGSFFSIRSMILLRDAFQAPIQLQMHPQHLQLFSINETSGIIQSHILKELIPPESCKWTSPL